MATWTPISDDETVDWGFEEQRMQPPNSENHNDLARIRLAESLTPEEYLNQPDVLPWERIPHESTKAWRAFCSYRDAGRKRSQAFVRGQGISIANKWPTQYLWTIRTRLYDEYTLVEEQIEQQKLNKEVRKRHAEQAAQALDGLMAPFLEYQRRFEQSPDQLEEAMAKMPATKLLSTMQASARVLQPLMNAERLSQDLPTEMVETHVQGQITVQDNPEALVELLGILEETGVGNALFGSGPVIEIAHTENEQVGEDDTPSEAGSLPANTS